VPITCISPQPQPLVEGQFFLRGANHQRPHISTRESNCKIPQTFFTRWCQSGTVSETEQHSFCNAIHRNSPQNKHHHVRRLLIHIAFNAPSQTGPRPGRPPHDRHGQPHLPPFLALPITAIPLPSPAHSTTNLRPIPIRGPHPKWQSQTPLNLNPHSKTPRTHTLPRPQQPKPNPSKLKIQPKKSYGIRPHAPGHRPRRRSLPLLLVKPYISRLRLPRPGSRHPLAETTHLSNAMQRERG
jgi:hypothetical protein